MRTVKVLLIAVISGILSQVAVFAQEQAIKPAKSVVKQMEMFEASLEYDITGINPYDYSKVQFKTTFKSPSSKRNEIEGFYSDDFEFDGKAEYLSAGGSFKARIIPKEAGEWTYRMELNIGGKPVTITAWETFTCKRSSDSRGFVRISPADTLFFEFENKEPFFAKGINMAWANQERMYEDYKYWIEKFSANGGNLIKIWMAPWSFGIETDKLGGYSSRQKQAAMLDQVFELCREHDVYIQMCLVSHGEYSINTNSAWDDNPYNSKNDGVIDEPQEFFTSKVARQMFKNRLRYIIARWGYSRNLFAWEPFNEADLTDKFDAAAVAEWHSDIFSFIKKYDVNKHLTTASFFDPAGGEDVWKLESIDFVQTHIYSLKDAAVEIFDASRIKTEKYNKPHIVGGFGPAAVLEGMTDSVKDEKGIQLHTGIWGGALSLSAGWPMIWRWDVYVDKFGLWDIYKPLSDFLRGINWARGDYFQLRAEKAYYYDYENKKPGSVKIYPEDRQAKAKKNRFIITPAGDALNTDQFMAFLYGELKPEMKNDPVLVMTNRFPAKLIIGINKVSDNNTLLVEINGERVFKTEINAKDQPGAVFQKELNVYQADCKLTYTVDLHAGDNEVTIKNTGADWIKLDYVEITDFTDPSIAPVFIAGVQSEASAYIWYKHRDYTWENTQTDKVEGSYIDVSDLRPGRYVIEYFDTYTGGVTDKKQVIKHEEDLRLDLPTFDKDAAIRIREYK
ncbi:MAG: DUF5060 domain-containing protein [Candidatus Goldbacteria bacterium]|nr:DUF5060 domain-containing protein [Candidatus Goldiibacteriota bacterium]